MIVQSREDLLLFAERESPIQETQPHRCAVSKSNLRWIDGKIICSRKQYCRFLFFSLFHPVADGIGIQSSTMPFDRSPDWSRMGCEKESRQVDHVRRKLKLLSHGLPVVKLERQWVGDGSGNRGLNSQQRRTDGQAAANKKASSVDRIHKEYAYTRHSTGMTKW